jgi:SpoVK/Ycf46/Vps4 family AAA+-type ATPase
MARTARRVERIAMADVEQLLTLFRAHRKQDDFTFMRAAEALISAELAANHHMVAHELRQALEELKPPRNGKRHANGHSLTPLPKDRRSGDALLAIIERPLDVTRLVLTEETRRQVDRIVEEHGKRLLLARSGFQPKSRVLLWGPPGCGKTLTAHYLSHALSLPLGVVRLSSLISSFVGDTASHIQRVFDRAATTPMVLLLDEVDAIGKNRDDPNDVGELKRVVNSLLQAMDSFSSTESVVVAASNHQYLLDPALWRRFDDVVFFPEPGAAARAEFVHRLLNGVSYCGSEDIVVKKTAGLSFAAIERVLSEAIKSMLLEDRESLQASDITAELRRFKRSLSQAQKKVSR